MVKMMNDNALTRQYLNLKSEIPEALLLMQLGDFFEVWGEDAEIAALILDISLNRRGSYTDGTPMPMCGIPASNLPDFVRAHRRVQAGRAVAIAYETTTLPICREINIAIWPETDLGKQSLQNWMRLDRKPTAWNLVGCDKPPEEYWH